MTDSSRFAFGKNWSSFLDRLDEGRIDQAVRSMQSLLDVETLEGKRFFDIGSGSGLFSLAAARLNAMEIVSIDYDSESVACTEYLRQSFAPESNWSVQQGSVLDAESIALHRDFDVVYSWGVLHHTGDMENAIANAAGAVRPGGRFAIAIYNDQGGASGRWLQIKQTYNRLPRWLRPCWVVFVAGIYELKFAAARLARLQNPLPFRDWKAKRDDRGMSAWHDWVDWIGGLPFEVATPEKIIVPLRRRGFTLEGLTTVGNGWGCNEFVFSRDQNPDDHAME